MPKLNIAIAVKDLSSVFSQFIFKQLTGIKWLSVAVISFQEVASSSANLFIVVLEDASLREIFDVTATFRTSNKNAIYLSALNNKLAIGPLHFPGRTAGADAAYLLLKETHLKHLKQNKLSSAITSTLKADDIEQHPDVFYNLTAELITELKAIHADDPNDKLIFVNNISVFKLTGNKTKPERNYVFPLFDNSSKPTPTHTVLDYKLLLSEYMHSKSNIKSAYFTGSNDSNSDSYNSVTIVGGGTAGYLTALSLNAKHPALKITLIESSKIPVIGVGEATTPDIRTMLFKKLKFSALDFYEKVKPTWKLGIKFFWGQPGDYAFNYPFGSFDPLSSYLVNGDINSSSLISVLMSEDSSFVVSMTDKKGEKQLASLSDDIQYALHLDNVCFIDYLKTKALERGIIHIDDKIIGTEKKENVNEISAVIGESGARYADDFFVDCTGFQSLLLEKALGSPYVSYQKSLFTDMAVTGTVPNNEKIIPYTYAESMNNGWCWGIPMRGEDHRGYVFSSAYCSVDEAANEIRAKNPAIGELKTVKFRSGRHQEICIGNVFAIGNSFAFVEPLESTGIHMIIREVEILTDNFLNLKKSPGTRQAINRNMNAHWDYIRDFLSIHYKFNKKFDTKFWKDVREYTDVSAIQWLLDLYNEVGLLSYAGENFKSIIKQEIKDEIFGLVGIDAVLLGQGVIPKNINAQIRNKNVWKANVDTWKSIKSITIPIAEDLDFLAQSFEHNILKV